MIQETNTFVLEEFNTSLFVWQAFLIVMMILFVLCLFYFLKWLWAHIKMTIEDIVDLMDQ